MKPTEKITEAHAAIADAKAEMQAEETAASVARTSQKGWPIKLLTGEEVLVVESVTAAAGLPRVIAEDGTVYEPYRGNPHNGYVAVDQEPATAPVEAEEPEGGEAE